MCIFAYGQTGSGKTFTMEGPPGVEQAGREHLRGMIPRAVTQVFESAAALEEKGRKYKMVSGVELGLSERRAGVRQVDSVIPLAPKV